MRLIKCRKCGATIATDETFIQRMMDDINTLTERARKDKRNAASYLQQAKAIRKIMQQYLHVTANMDTHRRRLTNELSVLIGYIRENNLITDEKLAELTALARERAAEKERADEERVAELYGGFENISINRTKADPTEKQALKGRAKA